MESSTMERPTRTAPLSPSPTSLRPGALVYLWAPGQPQAGPPTLVRVERATTDTILGANLTAGGARGSYPVTEGLTAPAHCWSWALVAQPEVPICGAHVEQVNAECMSIAERAEFMFGLPGTQVRVRLKGGNESILGIVSRLIIDGDDIRGVEITGPADSRGVIVHRIRYDEVAGTTFTGGVQ